MNTPEALVIDMTGIKAQVIIATLTSVGVVLALGSLVAGQWPVGLGIVAIVAVVVMLGLRDRRDKWRLRLVRRAGTVTLARGGTREVLPLTALADAQVEPAPRATRAPPTTPAPPAQQAPPAPPAPHASPAPPAPHASPAPPARPAPNESSAPRARVVLHFAADTGRAPMTLTQDARPILVSDAARLARVITEWLVRYRQTT